MNQARRNSLIRVMFYVVLLVAPVTSLADADPAIRPNGLVFNQVLPLTAGRVAELPLYLTRRGEYYAEVVLEPRAGGEPRRVVELDLDVAIARRDEVLFTTSAETRLGPERPVATLFWITSDRELPIKTPLTVAIDLAGVANRDTDERLRFQIRRKKNFGLRLR